jgi:hypothetical protein
MINKSHPDKSKVLNVKVQKARIKKKTKKIEFVSMTDNNLGEKDVKICELRVDCS